MLKGIWRVVGILSIATSILSMVMLLSRGVDIDWTIPAQLAMDYYNSLKHAVFGPLEPTIDSALAAIGERLGLELRLQPHWSDIVLLMGLYVAALARTAWTTGQNGRGLFLLGWGGLITILAGTAAGTVTFSDATSSMLMASFPLAGYVLLSLGDAVWLQAFHGEQENNWLRGILGWAELDIRRATVGGLTLLLGTQADRLPRSSIVTEPGLALLGILIVALALSLVWRGWQERHGRIWEDWGIQSGWPAFLENRNTKVGLLMLTTMLGTILFIALNAGLKLAGL